jgi:formylglycine-generating enzyme required for sulfatase activity
MGKANVVIASLACAMLACAADDASSDALDASTPDAPADAADAALDVIDAGDARRDSTVDASDASADAADEAMDADAFADAPPDAPAACPGDGGPRAIRVGAFCIDATEVTNADYARFLAADPSTLPMPPATCASNASYVPGAASWPPDAGHDTLPVVAVDWCDAYVYCAWIGKRLCGAIGGGPTPFASYADPATSAWYLACSNAGALAYPYGAAYDPSACNGKDRDGGAPLAVGSLASCAGGASSAIYDMSGNVYEWEDSCDGDVGASDHCRVRGGGFLTSGPPVSANLSCAGDAAAPRGTSAFVDVGFRCCGP